MCCLPPLWPPHPYCASLLPSFLWLYFIVLALPSMCFRTTTQTHTLTRLLAPLAYGIVPNQSLPGLQHQKRVDHCVLQTPHQHTYSTCCWLHHHLVWQLPPLTNSHAAWDRVAGVTYTRLDKTVAVVAKRRFCVCMIAAVCYSCNTRRLTLTASR